MENVESAGFGIRAAGGLIDWIPNWIAGAVAGATFSKRLLGLEVVSETLAPATFVQTMKRDLAFLAAQTMLIAYMLVI